MNEEFHELVEAMWINGASHASGLTLTGNYAEREAISLAKYAEVADGLADLMYVVLYTANAYGLDMQSIFNEVQHSNMTKVGGTIDKNGKLRKEDLPNYSPPNLVPIIMEQINGTS